MTAFVGSSVTLTCDATLEQFDVVMWIRNGSSNTIFMQEQQNTTIGEKYLNRVSLDKKKNLQISTLMLRDEAVYFCIVRDTKTVDSNPAIGSFVKVVVLGRYQFYVKFLATPLNFS